VSRRPINARVLSISITGLAILTLTVALLTRSGFFDQLDHKIVTSISAYASPPSVAFVYLFNEFGGELVWIILLVSLYFLGGKYGRRSAVILAASLLLSVVADLLSNQLFYRPRPYLVLSDLKSFLLYESLLSDLSQISPLKTFLLNLPIDSSFPSAHTIRAFAGAIALSYRYRRWALALFPLAIAVGFSRVYLGLHFPSDVLGGALIGLTVGLVVFLVERQLFKRASDSPAPIC